MTRDPAVIRIIPTCPPALISTAMPVAVTAIPIISVTNARRLPFTVHSYFALGFRNLCTAFAPEPIIKPESRIPSHQG